jgi:hypothetical protein
MFPLIFCTNTTINQPLYITLNTSCLCFFNNTSTHPHTIQTGSILLINFWLLAGKLNFWKWKTINKKLAKNSVPNRLNYIMIQIELYLQNLSFPTYNFKMKRMFLPFNWITHIEYHLSI